MSGEFCLQCKCESDNIMYPSLTIHCPLAQCNNNYSTNTKHRFTLVHHQPSPATIRHCVTTKWIRSEWCSSSDLLRMRSWAQQLRGSVTYTRGDSVRLDQNGGAAHQRQWINGTHSLTLKVLLRRTRGSEVRNWTERTRRAQKHELSSSSFKLNQTNRDWFDLWSSSSPDPFHF